MLSSDQIGIVGSIVGIIGIFLFFYQQYLNKADFQIISKSRQKALKGEWKGILTQNNEVNNEKIQTDCRLILNAGKRKIKGQLFAKSNYGDKVKDNTIKVNGKFSQSRFFIFDYENVDGSIVQFGNFLLELTSDGKRLTGEFLGFGPYSESIISGVIVFTKEDSS